MVFLSQRPALIARTASGLIGFVALMLICFEVFARYFAPHILPDWGSEIVIYLTVWAIFLGAGELAMHGEHVRADFLVDRLDNRKKRILGLLAGFTGLVFSGFFLYYGYEVVAFAHLIGEEGDSTLRFPKWIYYLALPVGMAMQCIGYMVNLWCNTMSRDTGARDTEIPDNDTVIKRG